MFVCKSGSDFSSRHIASADLYKMLLCLCTAIADLYIMFVCLSRTAADQCKMLLCLCTAAADLPIMDVVNHHSILFQIQGVGMNRAGYHYLLGGVVSISNNLYVPYVMVIILRILYTVLKAILIKSL